MSMRSTVDDHEFRQLICDWLRANGVDPGTIPIDARPTMARGQLTLRQIVKDERGRLRLDPSDNNRPLVRTVTVPIEVDPPPPVAEWLRPHCPTCGR